MIWAMKLLMGKLHMNSVLSTISERLLWTWVYHGFVTRVTRRLRLVEQEVLTLPEYLSSSPVFSDAHSLAFCVVFIDNIACPSVLFLLVIVLFVLLRIMVSDYPFSIFKLSCVTEEQSNNEFKNWVHFFEALLACKSVERITFCMKRGSASYKKYASVHAFTRL